MALQNSAGGGENFLSHSGKGLSGGESWLKKGKLRRREGPFRRREPLFTAGGGLFWEKGLLSFLTKSGSVLYLLRRGGENSPFNVRG